MIDGRVRIGIYRMGGIGDTVHLSAFAKAVKMKYFPCHITVYVRPDMVSVLEDNVNIDSILPAPCVNGGGKINSTWFKDMQKLNNKYEVFFDCRYVTKAYFNNPTFEEPMPIIDDFDKLFNSFTYSNRFLIHYGINTFFLPFLSTNLRATPDDMWIKTIEPEGFVGGEYIVLHTDSCSSPVKSWFNDYWTQVAEWLLRKPIRVVLIGKTNKDEIPCTVDYRNKLSLHETAYVIKNSRLMIGTESGMVHVARAVRTKSMVLFGSTPPSLFGYPENINIQVGSCRNCFGVKGFWFLSCGEHEYSKCMREITPEIVISNLKSIFGEWNEPEISGGEKLLRRVQWEANQAVTAKR